MQILLNNTACRLIKETGHSNQPYIRLAGTLQADLSIKNTAEDAPKSSCNTFYKLISVEEHSSRPYEAPCTWKKPTATDMTLGAPQDGLQVSQRRRTEQT